MLGASASKGQLFNFFSHNWLMNDMKNQRLQARGVIKNYEGGGRHLILVTLPKSQHQCDLKLHCCFFAGRDGLWEEKAQGHLGFALFALNPPLD